MTLRIKDTASQMRTDMSLGTAATFDAGTSANNVVQLDSSGRLPALNASAMTGLGGNLPIFHMRLTDSVSNQTINTWYNLGSIILTNGALEVDSGSCVETSNGRFTPNVAGKYFFSMQAHMDAGSSNLTVLYGALRKNGTTHLTAEINETSANANEASLTVSGIVDMNGTTDYMEAWYNYGSSTDNRTIAAYQTNFYGYRIGS